MWAAKLTPRLMPIEFAKAMNSGPGVDSNTMASSSLSVRITQSDRD